MNRKQYGEIIEQKLRAEFVRLQEEFHLHTVQSCVIDNLLPENKVLEIFHGKVVALGEPGCC
jgi:hypothetical protein